MAEGWRLVVGLRGDLAPCPAEMVSALKEILPVPAPVTPSLKTLPTWGSDPSWHVNTESCQVPDTPVCTAFLILARLGSKLVSFVQRERWRGTTSPSVCVGVHLRPSLNQEVHCVRVQHEERSIISYCFRGEVFLRHGVLARCICFFPLLVRDSGTGTINFRLNLSVQEDLNTTKHIRWIQRMRLQWNPHSCGRIVGEGQIVPSLFIQSPYLLWLKFLTKREQNGTCAHVPACILHWHCYLVLAYWDGGEISLHTFAQDLWYLQYV